MKTLVGVPVFRVPGLVKTCLDSLVYTSAKVLVVDNNADSDVKKVLEAYPWTEKIVNSVNGFCNGGWNQIMKHGLDSGYDIIGLGSSDAVLHPGWYDTLQARAENFTDEVWLPTIGEPVIQQDFKKVEVVTGGVAGFFNFLPRKAVELVYPIPANLRHWFGDQYMFEKLRAHGWKITLLQDMTAYHQQSSITAVTPEAYEVINMDKMEWGQDYDPKEHLQTHQVTNYITVTELSGRPVRLRKVLKHR
jgi:GT2 family glycosyltransferase